MEKQFQLQYKEEKRKTKSQKEMEYLDSVLEETEHSNEPTRHVTVYSKKINKKLLSSNIIMTCVWFGLTFILSGGSVWFGIVVAVILGFGMEWYEVDKIIEIPKE